MRFGYNCSTSGRNNVEVACDREFHEKNLAARGYVISFSPSEEYALAVKSMTDPAACLEEFSYLEKLKSSLGLELSDTRRIVPTPSHDDDARLADNTDSTTEREYWRQSLS
jgi:hypothetical protein